MTDLREKELFDLFQTAESRLKQIEQLDDAVSIAPLNELRYIAYHCLKFSITDDETKKNEHIRDAKNHCKRSIYDSTEGSIVYLLGRINIFNMDYKSVTIGDVFPDYLKMISLANKAQKFIDENNIAGESRSEHYEEIQNYCDELILYVNNLNPAREELNRY